MSARSARGSPGRSPPMPEYMVTAVVQRTVQQKVWAEDPAEAGTKVCDQIRDGKFPDSPEVVTDLIVKADE